MQLGRNAIYHYPVLTYSRIYNSKGDFNPTDTGGDVADSIDYASDDMPEGCPFELKSFVEGD